jgi:hypothetical protein
VTKQVLDELIEQITVDANGEDEELGAFLQAFEDEVALPADASVVGEPVSVMEFDYDGNRLRGLTAKCRRGDETYVISLADVVFPADAPGARYVAAYRKWMGLSTAMRRRKKAADQIVEMAVLSVIGKSARCRLLRTGQIVNLLTEGVEVPGEVVRVKVLNKWAAGDRDLSGEVMATRIDAAALGLTPLRLSKLGPWNPKDEYWGDPGTPIEKWAKRIIARGPRTAYEMEMVLPGYDFQDPDHDPIGMAVDLREAGKTVAARRALMKLCEADLRCLDAHAHLGNLTFEKDPKVAIRNYEVGVRIGELSLGETFEGLLPWAALGNRPFLRCRHGYGLCLWRLGKFAEAKKIFEGILWLNPTDNQGARFLLDDVAAKRRWEDSQ